MNWVHFHEYLGELELWTTVTLNVWVISSGFAYLLIPRIRKARLRTPEAIALALYQGAVIAAAIIWLGYQLFAWLHNYPPPDLKWNVGFTLAIIAGLAVITVFIMIRIISDSCE